MKLSTYTVTGKRVFTANPGETFLMQKIQQLFKTVLVSHASVIHHRLIENIHNNFDITFYIIL